MSHGDSYNGWTNRSTWMAELHLSNDESYYHTLNSLCEREPDVHELSDQIKDLFDEWMEHDTNLALDMTAVGTVWVNWDEIARSWIESYEGE